MASIIPGIAKSMCREGHKKQKDEHKTKNLTKALLVVDLDLSRV